MDCWFDVGFMTNREVDFNIKRRISNICWNIVELILCMGFDVWLVDEG
jgi:hypothetical protein